MEQTRGTGAQAAVKMQKSNSPHVTVGTPFSANVFYCPACDVPVVTPTSQIDEVAGKGDCPLCGGATKYLATDLRPVFPEERLLLELLLEAEPFSLAEKSVWAQDSRYYIDGKARSIPAKVFSGADTDSLSVRLEQLKNQNGSEEITGRFENQVQKFVRANRPRLNALVDEAHRFIREEAAKFPEENIVLSFSGGKDSTVTADLVTKALGNPSLVHVFGDTTLTI